MDLGTERLVSREELRRLGMTDHAVDAAARRCCLARVRAGWYLVFDRCRRPDHGAVRSLVHGEPLRTRAERLPPWEKQEILLRAGMASRRDRLGAGAVFSGLGAALMHGLPIVRLDRHDVEVSSPRTGKLRKGLRVHRRDVPSEDCVEVDGLPVTGLGRTIVDVSRDYGAEFGLAMLDHALRHLGFTREAVEEALARAGYRRRLRGVRLVQRLADRRRESVQESRCGLRLHEAGITRFTPQVEVYDSRGTFIGRVDYGNKAGKEAIETDGIVKYGLPGVDPMQALREEKERERALVRAGWLVHRLMWDDLGTAERVRRIVGDDRF